LRGAAAVSVLAHLIDLIARDIVTADGRPQSRRISSCVTSREPLVFGQAGAP